MAITLTWPTTIQPVTSDDYSFTETPRVRTAKFGDGYEQRTPDGINAMEREFPALVWTPLSAANKDVILNFLRARKGSEPFRWTPPAEAQSIVVKAVTWTVRRASGPWWTVEATFVRVFDL